MRHLRAEGGVSAIVGECGKPSGSWAAEGARTERWHVFVPVRWHVPAQVVTDDRTRTAAGVRGRATEGARTSGRCPQRGGRCPHQRLKSAAGRRYSPAHDACGSEI